MKRLIDIFILLLSLVLIVCSCSGDKELPSLGDTERASLLEVTFNNYKILDSLPDGQTAPEGMEYLQVNFKFTNLASEQDTPADIKTVKAYIDGEEYLPDKSAFSQVNDSIKDLAPGRSDSRKYVFEIPSNTTYIEFVVSDYLTGNSNSSTTFKLDIPK